MDSLYSNNDRPSRKRRPARRFDPDSPKFSTSTGKKKLTKSNLMKKSKGLQSSSIKKNKRKKSDSFPSRDNKRKYLPSVMLPKKALSYNARTLNPVESATKNVVGSIKSSQSNTQYVFSNRGLIQVTQTHQTTYKHRKKILQPRICVPLSFGVSQPLHLSSEQSTLTTLSHPSLTSISSSDDSMCNAHDEVSCKIYPAEIFKDAPALVYREFQEPLNEDFDLFGIPLPSLSDISTIESFDADDDTGSSENFSLTSNQVSFNQEDLQRYCNEAFDTSLQLVPCEFQNLQMSF